MSHFYFLPVKYCVFQNYHYRNCINVSAKKKIKIHIFLGKTYIKITDISTTVCFVKREKFYSMLDNCFFIDELIPPCVVRVLSGVRLTESELSGLWGIDSRRKGSRQSVHASWPSLPSTASHSL